MRAAYTCAKQLKIIFLHAPRCAERFPASATDSFARLPSMPGRGRRGLGDEGRQWSTLADVGVLAGGEGRGGSLIERHVLLA
jgi:hypothetical protein